jgi:hypothetical protein
MNRTLTIIALAEAIQGTHPDYAEILMNKLLPTESVEEEKDVPNL